MTTGHGAITSAVVLNLQRVLAETGRDVRAERIAFVGLGSIGAGALRLALEVLPEPAEVLLCDLVDAPRLEAFAAELRDRGHRVTVHPARAGSVPSSVYDATTVVGATNVGDVLDVDRLRPGCLVVDDSWPRCFDVDRLHAREPAVGRRAGHRGRRACRCRSR
ncbi:hypothetical protein GCM10025868_25460 [Angustibacter aerolatus]|uniref:Uncharacterized protein n=1 Tax=Angustibacter aerolatus TaxID=1162965 RepID=A0ABQ6JGE5_9ACTN|nr:hypothetical protein [Angustibacter aerolatus]GMA87296.1 hypothetical protein GCM10025868_25460 [Angustibacter aerolatus]